MNKEQKIKLITFLLFSIKIASTASLATSEEMHVDPLAENLPKSPMKAPLSIRTSPPIVNLSLVEGDEITQDTQLQKTVAIPLIKTPISNHLDGSEDEGSMKNDGDSRSKTILKLTRNMTSLSLEEMNVKLEKKIKKNHKYAAKWLSIKKMTLALITHFKTESRGESTENTLSLETMMKLKKGLFLQLKKLDYFDGPCPEEKIFCLLHLSSMESLMRLMNQAQKNFGDFLKEIENRVKPHVFKERQYVSSCIRKAEKYYQAVVNQKNI